MDLSVAIPVFNEQDKIERDLTAVAAFLQDRRITGELIVADDGSTDGSAERAGACPLPPAVSLTVLPLPHRGKGHALRRAIAHSRGRVVWLLDSGLCIEPGQALAALEALRVGPCQLVIGSRHHPDSLVLRTQRVDRRLVGACLRRWIRRRLPLLADLSDTQCGFKLIDGALARRLVADCRIDGFAFDLELLCLARRHGAVVREIPIAWTCDRDSRLSYRQSLATWRDLRRLRARFG